MILIMRIQNLQQKNGILLIVDQMVYSCHNPIKFLTKSIESCLCDYSDAYILTTGNINVTGGDNNTKLVFKIVHYSKNVLQKLMVLLLMKQIVLILQCLCIIQLNIVIIILIFQEVYGILKEMK